ncbi:tRNA N6-adenosine threonylcarbamoyltransferase, putative [Plasmodium berghei]|uniref:N(6)-L-threonylcarbamoyladenine synthase n=2 Tax=Plasmodium berghei TaxID=5821 RepID=A0A509ALE1_PLABA|nr:tRNA N6-adenosine threonylcarbamoyltransferase, putative [Plasmodium berghei ANKA]SCL93061.1 tRNA N6-adenosine threonylcarbamoyltransferase, putative [Plasmodium berghei]SCM15781.1 tRNA N6-adenosine threonylcarbamoyltransferase, putative [Plasmodium berghei]SCM17576.1 tRNA N6-adenosine threonylcarbamoyltransferase, putative [Plasmodium berghei]SCN23042.1 tRNA N6-adenosine threonylcarbamoyltransferase, putative [Plasmodium berghei]VUC54558.1 tRNA N6-adenosine threonylcarbamoyltransferase, pu|eukprot:XP_034420387.1 tRNA N6-adenosine threonylcarbamoyltransferase, putative [Plasmodium berghei ANKA]
MESISKKKMYILGMEGSANKLGISIIDEEMNILVNMRRTYVSEIGCGFIPREINAHHKYYIIDMIKDCLNKLKIKITDIGLICYTKGPGIGSALYVAYNISKLFSLLFNISVIGVNHCIAHIEMGIFITKLYHPIILYVSGSNTQIIYYNNYKKKYEIIGETLDIAIGNVIDRSARILKISNSPSPGYNVELWARKKKLLRLLQKIEEKEQLEIYTEKEKQTFIKHDNEHCNENYQNHIYNNNDDVLVSNTKDDSSLKFNKKENYLQSSYYNELLQFPYTIKGMDISFSGYDFYINKYFSKYINKNSKKGNPQYKHNKKKGTNKINKDEDNKKKQKINENISPKNYNDQNSNIINDDNLTLEEDLYQDSKNDFNKLIQNNEKNNNKQTKINTNHILPNYSFLHGMKGSSYYEDNIIYKNENKQNYGQNNEYYDDNCSIETSSDFYEKDLQELIYEEAEAIKLTEEEKRKIQICYSLQHHIFSMLIEITERAISFTNSKEVIIVGGVGCNIFLQNMMKKMAKQKNIKIGFMDHSYCVDNGAMIAYTGYLEYLNSKNKNDFNFENISIHQRYRTDDVFVTWR